MRTRLYLNLAAWKSDHIHARNAPVHMTGTVNDSSMGHTQRSRDIGPDTNEERNLRLINKRAQQLKDDTQSLKDRLERYVQLRATQWTPTHPSYNLFNARLKFFDTCTHKEGVPLPESLAEAGFFFRGIRGLLEKYPTFGREKETGLPGALDT